MFKPHDWLDRVFEIGIIGKGLNGAVELLGGLLLLFVTPEWIRHLAVSVTRVELSEDPHDFIATHLLHTTNGLTGNAVLFGAVYSWITLSDIEAHDPNRMVVDVYSQQYEWHFNYPTQGVTSRELHVPVDRQIEFRMHSLDVIHSFWVPEWRIKKDNVPGITTRAYITPTKAEDLTLVCTELCGFGHSTMRAPVVVEKSQADFDKWAAAQQPIPDSEPKPGETTPTRLRQ